MLTQLIPIALIISAIALVILAGVCAAIGQERCLKEYLDSHPPLSDEDFVKLCGPGVRPEMAIRVREIFAEELEFPKDRIYPDTDIISMMDGF